PQTSPDGLGQNAVAPARILHFAQQSEAPDAVAPRSPGFAQHMKVLRRCSEHEGLTVHVPGLREALTRRAITLQRGGQLTPIFMNEGLKPADTAEKLRVAVAVRGCL